MPDAGAAFIPEQWKMTASNQPPVTSNTLDAAKIIPPERSALLNGLAYVASIHNSWDECWGIRPTATSLTMAHALITRIPLNCIFPSRAAPDGDGGMSFFWKHGEENVIVTVDNTLLHISHTYDHEPAKDLYLDGISFDGFSLPGEVIREIPKRSRSKFG